MQFMELLIIRLLFDFGLLILIWMVQLVIYPSFLYYSNDDLLAWHRLYTQRISYVVLPLMAGQLGLAVFQLYGFISWYSILSLLIIGILWGITFLQFVPLHNAIAQKEFDKKILLALVKNNWLRTFLWTVLFILSLFRLAV